MSVMFKYRWCGNGSIETIQQRSKVYGEGYRFSHGMKRTTYKVYNVNRKTMEWVLAEDCEII